MIMRSADTIAERARGKYRAEFITQTNSVEIPIIERLSPEEQLHYVFYHPDKGFRIFEPDGEEHTPDHTSVTGAQGKRFFLVTDKRIIYIVGKSEEADDKIQSFGYEDITEVDGYKSKGASVIEFTTTDGRRYKFVNTSWQSDSAENVEAYVQSKLDSSTSTDPTTGHKSTTEVDSEEIDSTKDASEDNSREDRSTKPSEDGLTANAYFGISALTLLTGRGIQQYYDVGIGNEYAVFIDISTTPGFISALAIGLGILLFFDGIRRKFG